MNDQFAEIKERLARRLDSDSKRPDFSFGGNVPVRDREYIYFDGSGMVAFGESSPLIETIVFDGDNESSRDWHDSDSDTLQEDADGAQIDNQGASDEDDDDDAEPDDSEDD